MPRWSSSSLPGEMQQGFSSFLAIIFFLVTITSYSIISSWYCHKDYDDDEDEDDDDDDDDADAQVKECSNGEDEFDCDWHKRSTVDTVTTREQFER